jgi:hypothetical protein
MINNVGINNSVNPTPDRVIQVSYTAPAVENWQQRLDSTIAAMETETPVVPTTPGEVAQHARLRMLYAAAGRRDDATRPIPDTPPATQQFLTKEIEGLTAWLDAKEGSDAAGLAAESKPALADALVKLSESAPLVVGNVAFCTEVQSYGCTKRFEKYTFHAGQEVLLYAEVENFVSESTPKGYHTVLRNGYRIVTAQGQCVIEHNLADTEEYCQNRRRDFFIGYHLFMPKPIAPGKYSLQLAVEDRKSLKKGEAAIAFEIKEEKEKTVCRAAVR